MNRKGASSGNRIVVSRAMPPDRARQRPAPITLASASDQTTV